MSREIEQQITQRILELRANNVAYKEIRDIIIKEFGKDININALKKRVSINKDKDFSGVSNTETTKEKFEGVISEDFKEDGSGELVGILKLTREQKEDYKYILNYLGYNPENWVVKRIRLNTWGQKIDVQLYQVRLDIEPLVKEQMSTKEILENVREALKSIKPLNIKKTNYNKELDDDKMTFMPCPELHLNKIAWSEISDDYNLEIQEEIFNEIIERLIQDQKNIKSGILYLTIGNDFFHIDNEKGTTTSGTQLQYQTHYKLMVRKGTEMWAKALATLEPYYNKIELSLMPGNHSGHADFDVYESMRYAFKNNDKFEFSLGIEKTQAKKYGNNLIITDHGEKLKKLLDVIPTMFRKLWGEVLFVYVYAGHLHHNDMMRLNDKGMTYERVGSPSFTDEWHQNNHFLGSLKMQQYFVFHKKYGKLFDHFIIFEKENMNVKK